ncbi:hypothetical protein AVEN_215486-1, partial [Araneus ventricosus]
MLRSGLYSGFLPRWGDELFPKNPRLEIINGNFRRTDLMIGRTMKEGVVQSVNRPVSDSVEVDCASDNVSSGVANTSTVDPAPVVEDFNQ